MKQQTIQIFLKHYKDPDGRFIPQAKTCSDYTDGKGVTQKGCGAAVVRYVTYPREKGMYFDGEPVVVERFPPRQDGAVIAVVRTDNVHFATCTMKKRPERPLGFDGRAAAAGGQ